MCASEPAPAPRPRRLGDSREPPEGLGPVASRSRPPHDQAPSSVDLCPPLWTEDNCRLLLLDNRWTLEGCAGAEAVAVVYRHLSEALLLGKVDLTRAFLPSGGSLSFLFSFKPYLGGGAATSRRQVSASSGTSGPSLSYSRRYSLR